MNQNSANPFGNLGTEGLEQARDSLGGGGAIDSDVYDGTIKLAYAGASQGGARFLAVHIDINGRDYRETLYVTNKEGKNYWERDGKKNPLPGFTTANDLALMSTGVGLADQDIEEKVVNLYDFDLKKEIPTKVQALVSMMGKPITVAVFKQIEDKNKKNETTGAYEATGETREVNVIDKVFHTASGKTVSEFVGKVEAEFKGKWVEKNKGTVKNKAKGAAGNSGAPGASSGSAKAAPSKSLFG